MFFPVFQDKLGYGVLGQALLNCPASHYADHGGYRAHDAYDPGSNPKRHFKSLY